MIVAMSKVGDSSAADNDAVAYGWIFPMLWPDGMDCRS